MFTRMVCELLHKVHVTLLVCVKESCSVEHVFCRMCSVQHNSLVYCVVYIYCGYTVYLLVLLHKVPGYTVRSPSTQYKAYYTKSLDILWLYPISLRTTTQSPWTCCGCTGCSVLQCHIQVAGGHSRWCSGDDLLAPLNRHTPSFHILLPFTHSFLLHTPSFHILLPFTPSTNEACQQRCQERFE